MAIEQTTTPEAAPEAPAVETSAVLPEATEDDFEAIFAELTAKGETPPAEPAEPAETPPAETPEPEPEEEAPAVEEPEEEAPAIEAKAEEPAEKPVSREEINSEFERMRAELKQPAEEAKAEIPAPLYTAEESAQLEEYEKEWPDVAKAEALRRRGEYTILMRGVLAEVQRMLAPLEEFRAATTSNEFLDDVTGAHTDYSDAMADDIKKWIGEQSPTRQKVLGVIAAEGNADEVIDLISLYKEAKGLTTPTKAEQNPPVTKTLPAKATKAAQKLAVVDGKRSAPVAVKDSDDFEGAFEEFSKVAAN